MAGLPRAADSPWAAAHAPDAIWQIPDPLAAFVAAAAPVPRAVANDTTPRRPVASAQGIGIVSFLSAFGAAAAIFAVQFLLFVMLRNKLARVL